MDTTPTKWEQIRLFVEEEFEKALPTFLEFLRIPSQSRTFDPEYLTNGLLMKSAQLLKSWIEDQQVNGLTIDLLSDEGYSPFLYGEIAGSNPEDQTILFYGHMDKQPPFEGWNEGLHPYIPKIIDGKLYARGGADDGYSIFATIIQLKAFQKFGIKHPRIVMLFEADEESGSAHIFHYLDKLQTRIGQVELVICLDSGCGNYDQFWLTSTLRGNMVCTFTVSVLTEGVHSGDASGVVPSSFRIARLLLDRIENAQTGEVNSEFQVMIPGDRYKEAEQTADTVLAEFPLYPQMRPVTTNNFEAYLNRTWKAQLALLGCDNIPLASVAGNVLRPKTTLKFSLRLPPTLDTVHAEKTMLRLKNHIPDQLTQDVPYGAHVSIEQMRVSPGWNCPPAKPFVKEILNQASTIYFNKPALALGEGGSIPLMGTLSKLYPSSQFIISGVLGPNSNAHGPNEMLHIPFTKGLICSLIYFVAESYKEFSKSN